MDGHVPLASGDEEVLQPDVREGAAHHHLVVAAARAVRVEIRRLDAVLREVLRGGRALRDVAGGGDVVGRDGVAQDGEAARARDLVTGAGSFGSSSKKVGLRT